MAPSHRLNPRYDTGGCDQCSSNLRQPTARFFNAALLRAPARLSPPEMRVGPLSGIGELPLFNPDLEHHRPAPVAAYRSVALQRSGLVTRREVAFDPKRTSADTVRCGMLTPVAARTPP